MCDLAETYHIYDYRSLSTFQIAAFSIGLRDNSRIKMKMSGQKFPLETILLAMAVDRLSLLLWSKTKDATSGKNKPSMIVPKLLGETEKQESEYMVFSSAEEYEAAMRMIDGG